MTSNTSISGGTIRQRIVSSSFVWSAALVVFALPFGIKPTAYSIILLAVIWMFQLEVASLWTKIARNRMLWLFCATYMLMIASLLYTQNIKLGLRELEKGIALFLFPLVFATCRNLSREQLHQVLKSFILSNILFGIICVLFASYKFIFHGVNHFFNFDLVTLFRSHPTYYSMYLLFSLCCLLYLDTKSAARKGWETNRYVQVFIFVFFTLLIFLLSVRFIFLIYVFGVIVIAAAITIKRKKIWQGIVFLTSFMALTIVSLLNNNILLDRLLEIKNNYTYELSEGSMEGYNGLTTRLAQWESSLSIIRSAPILGVGPGDVQDELQIVYKKNFLKYSYRDRFNAHNQYVQTTLGLGLVGLAIFLATLILTAMIAWKKKEFLVVAFVTIFSLCCITESMLYVQKGVVFYSFFISLFVFQLLQPAGASSSDLKEKP